jgi:predicted molibdopterin-dependent oxidoreductase YjgC
MTGRLARLGETARAAVPLTIDGEAATALEGDTVLVALLTRRGNLGRADFGERSRAGFCLMGACQDCWVWTPEGERLRACTAVAEPGMRLHTSQPEGTWPTRA